MLALSIAATCAGFSASASGVASDGASDQARRVAERINLTVADVSGFADSGQAVMPSDPAADERAYRCSGQFPRKRAVAVVYSPVLMQDVSEHSFREVHSTVTVLPSPGAARRDLAALATDRARRCFVRAVRQTLRENDIEVSELEMTTLRVPKAEQGIATRVKIRIQSPGVPSLQFIDQRTFVRGRVEVTLAATASPHPFPHEREHALIRLLLKRARSATDSASGSTGAPERFGL
jgi:hypothetical protein